jgi:anti-sigma-K factor RskA
MTHEHWAESAAAYALDALDPEERLDFERHLHDCEVCQSEVDAYREVAATIAVASPAAQPADPAALRDRILRQARDVRALRPSTRRAPRSSSVPWLAAAAGLVLAGVAGVAWRAERARIAALHGELASVRNELLARDSTLSAFLGPEVHVVSLSAGAAKPAARVFWNHTQNIFIVTAFDLPPAPAGRTYQLWAISEGRQPIPMGTFETDGSGHATAVLPVAANVVAAGFIDYCGLTLEPDGGSPQPTEPPRLMGPWRHVD